MSATNCYFITKVNCFIMYTIKLTDNSVGRRPFLSSDPEHLLDDVADGDRPDSSKLLIRSNIFLTFDSSFCCDSTTCLNEEISAFPGIGGLIVVPASIL